MEVLNQVFFLELQSKIAVVHEPMKGCAVEHTTVTWGGDKITTCIPQGGSRGRESAPPPRDEAFFEFAFKICLSHQLVSPFLGGTPPPKKYPGSPPPP